MNAPTNGSLMRILPLVYSLAEADPETARKGIFNGSAITHGHSRSKLACWLYSEAIRNLLQGAGKAEAIHSAYSAVDTWVKANDASKEWDHFFRCSGKLADLPVSFIKSSGYVVDTLEAAFYSFLKNDDIWPSLLFSVNLGQDTDTVACVTGGLAGTYYGFDGLDPAWVNRLARHDEIETLISDFLAKKHPTRTDTLPSG